MIHYHKIFIGVEFGKKDVWKGNILYVIIITGMSTTKSLSKTYTHYFAQEK